MKIKKILLLIIITFILTGCSTNYNLKINLDGEVSESIKSEVTNSILEDQSKSKDEKKKYLEELIKFFDSELEYDDIVVNDDNAIINISKNYIDIYDYLDNSKSYSYLFKSMDYKLDKDTVTITTEPTDYETENKTEITISLPYKVISNNANEVDEKTNTYTWIIDDKTDTLEITFKTGLTNLYTYNLLKLAKYANISSWLSVLVFIIILFIIIFIIYMIIKLTKMTKNSFI